MNIQFKKGVLEMCVLVMLESGDRYGYDIANELSQSIAISNGTVYPILRRLKQGGIRILLFSGISLGAPPENIMPSPLRANVWQTL